MSSDGMFLDAAESIGRRIAGDAVWHDGRCTWVGAVAEPALPHRAEYRALGPALYGGTAGVGLFLALLAAATSDLAARRTAVGALRHAVRRAVPRDGFHSGSLGIAWAVARGGELLEAEELRAGSRALLDEARPRAGSARRPDVGMGAAGAALALLALGRVDAAVATGETVIARARVTRHGWSWPPGHLCGLAHGAGGIGMALLELFAATGDERFRAAGEGAFAYERSWLDEASGTWPDLRIAGQRRRSWRTIPPATTGTWCHGEAGIALSRLRATEVLGPGPHRDDARVALETTRRRLAEALPHEIEDLSLCHGAAGAADVLLSAAEADLAAELGRVAVERHGAAGDWPCGTAYGTTPALFLGLSGIGWLFLRLHDAAIPSPLVLPSSSG